MPPLPQVKRTIAECDAIICAKGGPFEIEMVEIDGRQYKNWVHQPPTYRLWMEAQLSKWAEREMISSHLPDPHPETAREHASYREVRERALNRAAWLKSMGVKEGTRVAIAGPNSVEWMVSYMAIHYLGGVPVFLNSHMQTDFMVYCLGLTKPMLVLADEMVAAKLGPLKNLLRHKRVGRVYSYHSIKHLPPIIRGGLTEINYKATSAEVQAIVDNCSNLTNLGPDSDCAIYYTSGTTGYPKAVLLTQRAVLHNMVSGQTTALRTALRYGGKMSDVVPPPGQMVILLPVPCFHATGSLSWITRTLVSGAKLVFMKRWNVEYAIQLMKEDGVTVVGGVPSVATAILQSPLLPKDQKLDSMTYGGAPPPLRLPHDIRARWPEARVAQGWGMTETSALHCQVMGPDYLARPDTVGPPVPICDVKIVDPDTRAELPTGSIGLILARGVNIMKCYVSNPEATAKTIDADGWLDTGDMGEVDEEGFLFIRDRAKDIIIRGGENIATLEVESALHEDNRIAEAAAVPVPCPMMGERVAALVSLAPGAEASAESIISQVKPRLRHAAVPVFIVVHPDPLPRNINGKLVKTDAKKIVQEKYKEAQAAAEPRARL